MNSGLYKKNYYFCRQFDRKRRIEAILVFNELNIRQIKNK